MPPTTRSRGSLRLRSGTVRRRRRPVAWGADLPAPARKRARKVFAASAKKHRVNAFVAGCVAPVAGAVELHIDAEGANTTRAVRRAARPDAVVHAVNYDRRVADEAVAAGATAGHAGVSTAVLRDLLASGTIRPGTLLLGYLDYCGSPDGHRALGFDPARDLACLAVMLRGADGVGLVTFCRRTRGGCALRKARALFAGAGLATIREHTYCETSPMALFLVRKAGGAMDARTERRYARAFAADVVR